MQRAAEKERILAEVRAHADLPPIAIERLNPNQDLYRQVLLKGKFLAHRQLLLDNRIYQSRAGYEVLTPFRLDSNGRIVLVSRGWVATGMSREVLPDIKFDTSNYRDISGIYTKPSRGFVLEESKHGSESQWPMVLQYVDAAELSELLAGSVIPGVVQADKNIGGDFPKLWQPVAFGPEKHYAYALQWFSFAILLCGLYVVLNCRKVKKN